MNTGIAIVGCGYVFDHYMSTWGRYPDLRIAGVWDTDRERLDKVCRHYGLRAYASVTELLADAGVTVVCNFTSIPSHYSVTRQALEAGKHVYSEKPLVTRMAEARELFALAESRGLRLSCAPSNALSESVQTMWRAIEAGAVGTPRIVYAEFDDNVIYRMHPETWRSRTGAPWPYLHEYESGCTYEHVGYHLTWLCAIFGPVRRVTAFSKVAIPHKTAERLDPPDTPDFSVACLDFAGGVVARVTCSIGVPYDHRMRVVGEDGMITVDTYRDYRCPVYLEVFDQLGLNARKSGSVRTSRALQRLFGIGGRRIPLARLRPVGGQAPWPRARWWSIGGSVRALKSRELGQQDKVAGVAELCDAIRQGREQFPGHDFTLHLTELTLAIQGAGVSASSYEMTTDFAPVRPRPLAEDGTERFGIKRQSWLGKLVEPWILRLHRH